MVLDYSNFIYLIANILRVFSIGLFLETVFSKQNVRCPQGMKWIVFILYYIINSIIYLRYQIPTVTVISNVFLFMLLTMPYRSTIYKRIFAVSCIFLLGVLCEAIVARTTLWLFGWIPSIKVIVYTLSNFLFYIVVLLVKSIFGQQEEGVYPKWRWVILITIPSISSVADVLLLHGGYEEWITVAVVACLFMMNIAFFYLYHIIVCNCEIEIQNQSLILQNKAYQQQLDMIHATEERLQRAKHDFQNHLIVLEQLTKSNEANELKEYFEKLTHEYISVTDSIYTGNKILDGLINHKLEIMRCTGAIIHTNFQIPEEIEIDAFDLVVIIGNLLDNAIEALSQQKQGSFEMEMHYEKGLFFIDARNTYTGEIIKKGDLLVSTKSKSGEVHGIGLNNIKRVVEQYHGEVMIYTENDIFRIHIVMYV